MNIEVNTDRLNTTFSNFPETVDEFLFCRAVMDAYCFFLELDFYGNLDSELL
jgi:hypothetical protein